MPNDPIRRRLEALPPPPLPEDLWPRLLARRARRRSRLRWLGAAAGVASAACALLLAWPAGETPEPADVAVAAAPSAATAPAADAAVAAIDRALQAAYSRGATDTDVAPLWEIRRQLATGKAPSDGADPS